MCLTGEIRPCTQAEWGLRMGVSGTYRALYGTRVDVMGLLIALSIWIPRVNGYGSKLRGCFVPNFPQVKKYR